MSDLYESDPAQIHKLGHALTAEFDVKMGCPWRWADPLCTKPYETVEFEGDNAADHLLAYFIRRKSSAGYGVERKPVLYMRWLQYVRETVEGRLECKFYLDGNPGRPVRGNPSKPRGRPTVGQVRLAA